jgi:hypothetical protein
MVGRFMTRLFLLAILPIGLVVTPFTRALKYFLRSWWASFKAGSLDA